MSAPISLTRKVSFKLDDDLITLSKAPMKVIEQHEAEVKKAKKIKDEDEKNLALLKLAEKLVIRQGLKQELADELPLEAMLVMIEHISGSKKNS